MKPQFAGGTARRHAIKRLKADAAGPFEQLDALLVTLGGSVGRS